MKELVINGIEIKDFKGVKNFKSDLYSKTVISGKNGSGKTTVEDAFMWTMFGKDSEGRTKFNVKPLLPNGDEKVGTSYLEKGAEPNVTLKISLDGESHTLSKRMVEQWVTTSGESEKHRSGDKTEYFIDDVPQKKKEFDDFVSKIVSEDKFKVLTDPRVFPSLNWKKQREMLVSIIGNPTTTEIQDSLGLKDIEKFLGGKTALDVKAAIASKTSANKKLLDELPVRIDEILKNQVELPEESEDELKSKIDDLEKQAIALKNPSSAAAEIKREIENLTMKNGIIYSRLFDKQQKAIHNQQLKVNQLQQEKNGYADKLQQEQTNAFDYQNKIEQLQSKNDLLKERFKNNQAKHLSINGICPECGQSISAEISKEIENRKNESLSKSLKEIQQQGKETVAELESTQNSIKNSDIICKELSEKIDDVSKQLDTENKKLNDLSNQKIDYPEEYKANQEKIKKIKSESEAPEPDNSKYTATMEKIANLKDELNKFSIHRSWQGRISELKDQIKTAKGVARDLNEKSEFVQKIIIGEVDVMQEKASKMFKDVDFLLFNKQKNGGIQETCELRHNGVPYSDLNSGARINAGLEVIKVLQENMENIKLPVFIDNAESVNSLVDTGSQMIELRVSGLKNLKVTNGGE